MHDGEMALVMTRTTMMMMAEVRGWHEHWMTFLTTCVCKTSLIPSIKHVALFLLTTEEPDPL